MLSHKNITVNGRQSCYAEGFDFIKFATGKHNNF